MRLFQPCSLAIRHNLFVPPPTKDILWLRATTPAPMIPTENRKYLNCFLSLCVFSWFSPPSSYSFNLVFFIFNGSFSKFFLSLAWMRITKPVGLTFLVLLPFAFNFALIKCRLLRFVWQVLFLTCRCNYCFCFVFLVFCVLLRVPLQFVVGAGLAALLPA